MSLKKHLETRTKKEQYNLIRDFYKRAKTELDNNNEKAATKILYEEMPSELYDSSLVLLYDRNININISEDKQNLIDLIRSVDMILYPEDYKEDKYE